MKTPIVFNSAVPMLPAIDLEKAIAFYEEKLGFRKDFQWGDPIDYAGVIRDRIELHLFQCDDRELPHHTSFRINVSGIEGLFQEYQSKNVIHPNDPLSVKPWGFKEFSILDLNGICIAFCEPAMKPIK